MKKIIFVIVCCATLAQAKAQEEKEDEKKRFFKAENCFTGGTVNLAFGNVGTQFGIIPYFGYSLNRFVDFGVSVQYNYISQRDYPYEGDKVRQKVYGPGAFVRLFPVDFLFAQAQYEFNMIRVKYIPYIFGGGTNDYVEKYKYDAHSLLLGLGYAGGRDFQSDEKSYYYISILWDVGKAINSPYKDNTNHAVPIIRAGYNVALFQNRGRSRNDD